MKNRPYFFWDGRAASLERQSLMPIQNPDEMGLPARRSSKRLNESAEYKMLFQKYSNQKPDAKTWRLHFRHLNKRWKLLTANLMTGAIILENSLQEEKTIICGR